MWAEWRLRGVRWGLARQMGPPGGSRASSRTPGRTADLKCRKWRRQLVGEEATCGGFRLPTGSRVMSFASPALDLRLP